jgi:hypothetical protein
MIPTLFFALGTIGFVGVYHQTKDEWLRVLLCSSWIFYTLAWWLH